MKQLIAFLFCLLPMAVLAQVPPYVHNNYDTQAVAQVDARVVNVVSTNAMDFYSPAPGDTRGLPPPLSVDFSNRILNTVLGNTAVAVLDWYNQAIHGTWNVDDMRGYFSGNGSGLTNIPASGLVGLVAVISTSTIPAMNVGTLHLVNSLNYTNLSSGTAPNGAYLASDGMGGFVTSVPGGSTNSSSIGNWTISSNTNLNYLLFTNAILGYPGADLLITPDIPNSGLNMAFGDSSASNSSVAFSFATATGLGSFAAGGAFATGDFSFAAGGSIASGVNAYAVGGGLAAGDYSISIGNTALATNDYAIVIGDNATAGGVSTVVISANGNQATPDVFTNNNAICLAGIGGFNLKGPFLVTKKSNSLTITNGSNSRAQWVVVLAISNALGSYQNSFDARRPYLSTNTYSFFAVGASCVYTNTWTWNVNPNTTNTIIDTSGGGSAIRVIDSHLEQ